MDIELWKHRLEDLPLGELYLYQEVGSTNQVAETLLCRRVPQFSIVLADSQTQGKGRLGRSWITRKGKALAFSLIIYPQEEYPQDRLEMFSGLGALALAEVLKDEFQLAAQIKWPNDVLVDGMKVAGVLVELHWSGTALNAVVIGVGVNVQQGSVPDVDHLSFPAGSLEELRGEKISRLDLLIHILQRMLTWYPRLAEEAFVSSWNSLMAFKGEQVDLLTEGGIRDQGELVGLAANGCLLLRSRVGDERQYAAGEIQLRQSGRSSK